MVELAFLNIRWNRNISTIMPMYDSPQVPTQLTSFQKLRLQLVKFVECKPVMYFIVFLIVLNAIGLGLTTVPEIKQTYGEWIILVDTVILWVFVTELILKFIAYDWRFFRNGWNVFDLLIISTALVPANSDLAILRVLRILRLLRALSVIPNLRLVVEALLKAVPGISSIVALILVFYYIFAVIATKMFGQTFPEWFGTLPSSMYTLFQIMTLESWSMGIARPVMAEFEYAWIFFVTFILVASFTMLNLFVAVMVDTMQTLHDQENAEARGRFEESLHADSDKLNAEIQTLRHEIQELKVLVKQLNKPTTRN